MSSFLAAFMYDPKWRREIYGWVVFKLAPLVVRNAPAEIRVHGADAVQKTDSSCRLDLLL